MEESQTPPDSTPPSLRFKPPGSFQPFAKENIFLNTEEEFESKLVELTKEHAACVLVAVTSNRLWDHREFMKKCLEELKKIDPRLAIENERHVLMMDGRKLVKLCVNPDSISARGEMGIPERGGITMTFTSKDADDPGIELSAFSSSHDMCVRACATFSFSQDFSSFGFTPFDLLLVWEESTGHFM